jgi:Putative Na+/H+ antiporter
MSSQRIQWLAAALLLAAIAHTLSVGWFQRQAARYPRHSGLWHLLGEVECVFGLWALVLLLGMAALDSPSLALHYLDSRQFTEPMFVFVVMVIAATRPVLVLVRSAVATLAGWLPGSLTTGEYFVALAVLPLLGSFITEPAAMTVAALVLRDRLYAGRPSLRLQYATLGVLLVNVSIGGTLSNFAAPPILMVARPWGWDNAYMLSTFGWRAAVAVACNAALVTAFFRRELLALQVPPPVQRASSPPAWLTAVHMLFLVGVVACAHHPVVFIGLLLLFLGFSEAYGRHQDRLILREGLLVGFFLAGLVVLGGLQDWWLAPLLQRFDAVSAFYGAVLLTAVTDNAALTYLASQVDGLSEAFKQALVAGAVAGGGLTVIANAPNPAAFAMLRGQFAQATIKPGWVLLAAVPPTLVAVIAFRGL